MLSVVLLEIVLVSGNTELLLKVLIVESTVDTVDAEVAVVDEEDSDRLSVVEAELELEALC